MRGKGWTGGRHLCQVRGEALSVQLFFCIAGLYTLANNLKVLRLGIRQRTQPSSGCRKHPRRVPEKDPPKQKSLFRSYRNAVSLAVYSLLVTMPSEYSFKLTNRLRVGQSSACSACCWFFEDHSVWYAICFYFFRKGCNCSVTFCLVLCLKSLFKLWAKIS